MDRRDFNDIGKEIRTAVQDAISSMDFADLNHQITDSVNEALEEIQFAFRGSNASEGHAASGQRTGGAGPEDSNTARRRAEYEQKRAEEMRRRREEREQERLRQESQRQQERAEEAAYRREQRAQLREDARRRAEEARRQAGSMHQKRQALHDRVQAEAGYVRNVIRHRTDVIARRPKGAVAQVLFTVFGSVLLSLGVLLSLLFGTIAMTGDLAFGVLLVLLGLVIVPVGGCGIWMLARGAGHRGRVERFRAYVNCIQDKNYIKISELAEAVHKSEKYVRKDLKKMIALRMFPQGHISEQQNLFILDHSTFAEYETMRQEVESKSQALKEETREQRLMRETTERGREYLAMIRKANDAIPGVEISGKLSRLEKAVGRIYEQIQKSPDKLPELRRFQDYYLPTTLKLVETYREFDAQPIAGENITTAKREIEASLDTINQAFEKLFDSLFADTAMDVSTDISVLQTLLAQEGLTEEDWKAATEPDAEYMWDLQQAAGADAGQALSEPAGAKEQAVARQGMRAEKAGSGPRPELS